MTIEEAIKALRLMEHVESISVIYEPGEVRNDTTVRELKEACDMATSALRAQTTFNGAYVSIEWLKQVEAERDSLKSKYAEIVHCKECKRYFKNNNGQSYGCFFFNRDQIKLSDEPKPDDFCSYGVRQDAQA